MNRRAFSISFAILFATGLAAGAARAETSACSDGGVLSFIDHRFDYKASHYLRADLDILAIHSVQPQAVSLRDPTHPVERVYCHAKADMNDGRRRDLWYMIESGMGFAGLGQRIRFCISGLDPWHVDGRHCRSVR